MGDETNRPLRCLGAQARLAERWRAIFHRFVQMWEYGHTIRDSCINMSRTMVVAHRNCERHGLAFQNQYS